jgi:hypothetical protein
MNFGDTLFRCYVKSNILGDYSVTLIFINYIMLWVECQETKGSYRRNDLPAFL